MPTWRRSSSGPPRLLVLAGQARPVLDAEHAHRALGRLLEQVDRAQERRLPRAGRAEDDDVLAGVDGQVDAVQHLRRAERLLDPAQLDDDAPCSALRASRCRRSSSRGSRTVGKQVFAWWPQCPHREPLAYALSRNGCRHASQPPSTTRTWPVTYEAASEDRNVDRRRDLLRAVRAGRAGPASRPSAASSAPEARPSVRSVSTVPGATALTRTPLPADLARSRLREEPDGALGGVVDRHRPGRGGEARRRADRDDAAASARRHRPNGGLDDEEDAADVHVHQPVVLGRLDVDERAAESDAGVRDDGCRAASRRRHRRPPRARAPTSVTSSDDGAGGETASARGPRRTRPPQPRRRRRRRCRRPRSARARAIARPIPFAPPTTSAPRAVRQRMLLAPLRSIVAPLRWRQVPVARNAISSATSSGGTISPIASAALTASMPPRAAAEASESRVWTMPGATT